MSTKFASRLSHEELQELLSDAQQKLFEAIEKIREYCDATKDEATRHTLLASIEIVASSGHDWLGSDRNLDDLMNELGQQAVEDFDEDEE